MKKKDILILIVASCILLAAVVGIYLMLFPSTKQPVTSTDTIQTSITGKIDQTTLDKVNELKSYATTNLDNIGRTDPFGPLK